MFLFGAAIDFMNKQKSKSDDYQNVDIFEAINKTVERRMMALGNYTYLFRFVANAYYETHDDITSEMTALLRAVCKELFLKR